MPKNHLYIYKCFAIDYWDGWQTISEAVAREHRKYADSVLIYGNGGLGITPPFAGHDPVRFYDDAVRHATRKWGSEDLRAQGPYFAPFPLGGSYSGFMVAWKVDNNGDTYVASPYPLPHLADNCAEWIAVPYDHHQNA